MREYSTIYSDASIDAAKKLINEFLYFCGSLEEGITADDLFYFNVFCDASVYAYFTKWEEAEEQGIDIPTILRSDCTSAQNKLEYVEDIIEEITTGQLEKPEWMRYVEENSSCDWCEQMPSTYLRIIAKSEEYSVLACRLLQFLYSPNRQSSIVKC